MDILEGTAQDQHTTEGTSRDPLEHVQGEIVPADFGSLPDGITDNIYSAIDAFCNKHGFDNMEKCRQPSWGACCMFIGQTVFKPNRKLLAGATPKNGGFRYDFNKISAVADIWIYLCGAYGKAPFINDFANFCGIDKTFLYGVGGHYGDGEPLTASRVQLLQKLKDAQETGLAGLVADGRQNPTGALACLNHWHGWTTTKEIIHTTAAGNKNAVALPVFGENTHKLEETRSNETKTGEN